MKLFKSSDISDKIEKIALETQKLVDAEYKKYERKDLPKSLNQVGLRNGISIVQEFNVEKEYALALEHICYMIGETKINLNQENKEILKQLIKANNLENNYKI